MTTMGKILVFINLLFSLVTGALIIMVFITRTHWAAGYADVSRQLQKEQANYLNLQQAKNDLEANDKRDLTIAQDKVKAMEKELQQKDLERVDALNKKNKAEQERDQAEATVKRTTAVAEAMKVEIKSLDDRLADQQQTILKLGLQNKEYKSESITAKTNLQTTLDRNKVLLEKLVETTRQLTIAQGEQAAKAGRDAPNPPPDDIRGRVMITDDANGWITINLGSDSGLNKGNTLEVYRLKPRPTYVGTMRIFEVRPHEAVGKLMGTGPRARVQKDDEVASKIP
jgi:hypothetical protein